MPQGRRSLAEILTVPVQLSPEAATAIVRQLCGSVPLAAIEGTPAPLAPEHVQLDRGGTVHLSPGVVANVGNLGALLEQLLVAGRRHEGARLPPGLVLVAARATGQIDAVPFESPATLANALVRFDSADPNATLRRLWAAAVDELMAQRRASSVALEAAAAANAPADVIGDYEYHVDPRPLLGGRPPPRWRDPSWLRRSAVAALAVGSFVAGATTAILRQVPRSNADLARAMTEVVVAPFPAIGHTVPAPTPPVAPRANVNPPQGDGSPAQPSTRGHLPRANTSAQAPDVAGHEPAPERPDVAAAVPATRRPQPLVDRDQVDAEAIYSPSFGADGTALFFQAESVGGSALKRAERGESGVLHVVTIVGDAAKNYHVKLSPDGRSLAFDSDRDGVRGVYLARADGSGVRRVSGAGYAAVPTWSPDGRRLAFLRAENDRPNVWNLWLIELATGETERLTNHPYGQVWAGAWFPEGRRIAYSHESRLILLDLDSKRSTSYNSPRPGRLVRTPAVSPDGRWVMFQVFRDGGWLLDLESGSMQRVLDDPSAEEFTWAPDGRRVAFHSRRSGEWGLWLMAAR